MSGTIRTTVNQLAQYLATNIPNNTIGSTNYISADVLQGILTTYNNLYSTAAVPLTAVTPDYESNAAELEQLLNNTPNPIWNQTVDSATGQMLISISATWQAFNQFSIERAYQESMLDFAQLPSSIYTISRMLGVTIAQKQPASCSVTLTLSQIYTTSIIIPAYTQINIGSLSFYNRNAIVFAPGQTTQNTTVYQGTVQNIVFYSSGLPSQTFSLQSLDFDISQYDIVVTVNGSLWNPTTFTTFFSTGLWNYNANSTVYYQSTDSAGNTALVFGNGNYGAIPPVNAQINVTYATTLGANGNIDILGSTFNFSLLVNNEPITIAGQATSSSINGLNERLPQEYAIISPATYSAKLSPTTIQEHNVFALNYPGVIDASFQNQQSFAPYNLNFMMVLQVTLLTTSPWTSTDYQNFFTWLQNYSIANMQFISVPAVPITVNISANVFCSDQIPLQTLQNQIQSALQAAFSPQAGYIGYSIYQSDIIDIIKGADPNGNIQIVQLLPPTVDNIVSTSQYLVLGTVNLNMQISNRNTLGA